MGRAAIVLFVLGATVGSALDGIHTHSGTTAYAHEIVWRMAWWTPFVFGFAGVGIGLGYSLVERRTRRPVAPDATWTGALAGFGLFALLYFASGYLPVSNTSKLVVLGAGVLVLFVGTARTRVALVLACVAAVLGPAFEVMLVALGAFRHLQPDALGIPVWLPALYAAGSFGFGVLGNKIERALRPRSLTPWSAARSLP
jgi:insulin-induced protein INSIG